MRRNIRLHAITLCTAAAIMFAAVVAAEEPVVKAFHPDGPMPSFEVATIKPVGPDKPDSGMTVRQYIAMAYGVPMPRGLPGNQYEGLQVLGGPEWIDKDRYVIDSRPPDELREAMRMMSDEDRRAENEMLDQSLLRERFHLKVHFETREMSVLQLVPAKGGLKITPVDPPPPGAIPPPTKAGGFRPGTMSLQVGNTGLNILNGRSVTMEQLSNVIRGQAAEIAGRPVIDDSGFHSRFDLNNFRFSGLAYTQGTGGGSATDPDVPSLAQALEEQLGLKLVRTKAQVEVVVIDSMDRPTEN